ncbi:class E sortase [Rubrobacter aplysinae]|uniref:class E sortase n=1 Tax=Rubrobacter aplysinae TaxID=909625 RepID=UPI001364A7D7|nr:class E sortase [Rubrobacter aplysinae]
MSDRSRNHRRYRHRRRRPALLGATAFASVIILALGGLTLVGLDNVGSKGMQLSRVSQPEVAQAPEVTKERGGGEQAPSNSVEKSSEAAPDKAPEQASSGAASDEKSSGEKGSNGSSENEEAKKQESDKKAEDKKDKQEKQEKQEPEPPPDPRIKTMWMSIPKLGMYSDTVYNSSSHEQMGVGAIKLPPTGFPWQNGANTYISAHRIGYPGTQSYNQFYALPAMQQGDMIYVGDANGTQYKYRVTKKFAVKPWENWVTEPKAGKDLITLQTCVDSLDPNTWWDISPKLMRSGPDSARMIVRAEKVDTYYPQQYQ